MAKQYFEIETTTELSAGELDQFIDAMKAVPVLLRKKITAVKILHQFNDDLK